MNFLDLVILILLVAALLRGLRVGFFRQVFSFAGFWLGFFVGVQIANRVAPHLSDPATKALVSLICVLGAAMVAGSLGELIGYRLSRIFQLIKLGWLDRLLGAAAGMVTTLVTFWLITSLLAAVPAAGLRKAVAGSRVIGFLDDTLPPPPTILAELEQAFHFAGFPDVFIGQTPAPAPPVSQPQSAEVEAIAAANRASVVKIEGLSCGGISAGSGFVAAPDLVVTNAHVVAGVDRPLVRDDNGIHKANLVLFDPDLDIAILRSSGLSSHVLALAADIQPRGTTGAVLGYPEGGPFAAVPAAVLQELKATGRNIYNQGVTTRSIYEVQANVVPGNSGGPFMDKDGRAIGVVFAKAEDQNGVGYVLTADQVQSRLNEAAMSQKTVSSGPCISE